MDGEDAHGVLLVGVERTGALGDAPVDHLGVDVADLRGPCQGVVALDALHHAQRLEEVGGLGHALGSLLLQAGQVARLDGDLVEAAAHLGGADPACRMCENARGELDARRQSGALRACLLFVEAGEHAVPEAAPLALGGGRKRQELVASQSKDLACEGDVQGGVVQRVCQGGAQGGDRAGLGGVLEARAARDGAGSTVSAQGLGIDLGVCHASKQNDHVGPAAVCRAGLMKGAEALGDGLRLIGDAVVGLDVFGCRAAV